MILVFGSKGHAKVVIDVIEKESQYDIFGLIGLSKDIGEETLGYKVVGIEENLKEIISNHKIAGGVIAIGDNWFRKEVKDKILRQFPNFNFVSCTHPSAQIAKDVTVGEGTVIMPGVIVNSSCIIGKHCILNTNSSLDHDSVMNDFSSLGPNATTGGNVKIGQFSAISLGANIMHNIEIGEHSVIGAGSLVNQDINDLSVFYGVPAQFIRTRKTGEKYLLE